MPGTLPSDVQIWFDPTCPFTWRTSRWLVDVAQRRGLDVTWHVMSLAILNEGREIPEPYRSMMGPARVVGQVFQAVRDEHGNEGLARFYTEAGTRRHEDGRDYGPQLYREALAAAGLPSALADVGGDDKHAAALADSHAAGQSRVGQESGSPIVAVGQARGFFGPIVVPVPTDEDALSLFDAVATLSRVAAFSELKGTRNSL